MKNWFGWTLVLIGLLGFGMNAYNSAVYRFAHPELTETQLMLWELQRWWQWLPGLFAGCAGLGVLLFEEKREHEGH